MASITVLDAELRAVRPAWDTKIESVLTGFHAYKLYKVGLLESTACITLNARRKIAFFYPLEFE